MTHPFDEEAVAAAEKAIEQTVGMDWPSKDCAEAALSAAFKSARERGMARDGSDCKACWNEGSEAWLHQDWNGPNFPVTIIRHKEPT